MNTRNFGLLIADDNPKTRENYQEYLTEHPNLRDIWVYDEEDKKRENVKQAKDASGALEAIKEFIEDTSHSHPMIVLADAYMPPNSDGDKPIDKEKLFGGLKLIDEINKNEKLKERVTVILITFYNDDELIQEYRDELQPNFKWKENIDYYFISKILSREDGLETEEDSLKKLSEADNELREKVFAKTLEVLLKVTDRNSGRSQPGSNRSKLDSIIGESEPIRKLKERIKIIAPTNRSILLLGERGTGKDLIAEAIHSMSKRKNKEMLKKNCANIHQELADTILFGHTKGSYTGANSDHIGHFEAFNKKTIFLNEIGELPKPLQSKLLQVIEEGTFIKLGKNEETTVDVRIIAATNQDVYNQKKFRADVRDRFDDIIEVPPLRERKQDISDLVRHFQTKYNKDHKKNVESFQDVIPIFKNLNWPGNVRQLEKTVDTLILYVEDGKIGEKDLEDYVGEIFEDENSTNISLQLGDEVSADVLINAHIIKYLKGKDWNINKSYRILGFGDSKLYDFKRAYFELKRNNWNIERTSEILGKKFLERLPKNELENIKKAHFKLNPSLKIQ